MALYEPLFDGAIDIIGDVHGEIIALKHLMSELGYDESGQHPEDRRLVFLGDLVDRGPDSPAVLDIVISLVEAGRAQCILGNHELNILLNRPMHGNGWIIQHNPKEKPGEFISCDVDDRSRDRYIHFFQSLPVVLENHSLRISHACWNQSAVEQLKNHLHDSVQAVYEHYQGNFQQLIEQKEFAEALASEEAQFYDVLRNPDRKPQLLTAIAEKEYLEQMINPIRTLTTSSMKVAKTPFFGGGKWRMAERDAWWEEYTDEKPVIIGHFWRQFNRYTDRISGVFGRDLFENIAPHAWMGGKHNVYCVDYSVGQRHIERKKDVPDNFFGKLAALRMPERQVMHDDGILIDTY